MRIEIRILNKEFYLNGRLKADINDDSFSVLPSYATPGSAAMDLRVTEDVTLCPGERRMLPTGLAIWIGSDRISSSLDMGVAGLILPRSGLGTKGLVLANTVGLIDEDFQGELMISAWNSNNPCEVVIDEQRKETITYHNIQSIKLKAGDRIAQLMLVPIIKAQWQIVDEFSNKTQRGENGWGSTNEKQKEK